jgi:hypothetical protein
MAYQIQYNATAANGGVAVWYPYTVYSYPCNCGCSDHSYLWQRIEKLENQVKKLELVNERYREILGKGDT